MDLRLDVSERDGWSVLTVGGEIDVATAPRLREQLLRLVGDGNHRIVVDLGEVDFIDSTGLGVLIGALKRVRAHDGDLALVCTENRILKVFEITGLDRVFRLHPSVVAAVEVG
jgi:anti-sigma B factor antagonist